MKKITTLILSGLCIPQLVFAAWWNPFSWNIFSSWSTDTSQTITATSSENLRESEILKKIDSAPTVSVSANKTRVAAKNDKVGLGVTSLAPASGQIKAPGTLCNGAYWNSCPSGQNFVCPQSGSAYCEVPQQSIQQNSQTSPGPYAGLVEIYGPNGQTSYVVPGAALGPGWSFQPQDETKNTKTTVNTQTIQQQDYSISDSSCETASKNLEAFQTSFANNYAALSSTMAANNIVQARLQIFANQYNTALPGYQMAAQAACQALVSNSQCQTDLQKFDTFQAQHALSPINTSGMSQIIGNQTAMQLGNFETEIYYACK